MKAIHNPALDLNLIKVFDALLETRNVSRAADALGVSQSAVSHALARLRTLVGDPLFVRTGNRMEPTPRAQRLAEPLRDLLVGENNNPVTLDGYLDFRAGAGGVAVIDVHANGAGSPVTQSITLSNITYADLQTYAGNGGTDQAIIQKLLADGNLKTDI